MREIGRTDEHERIVALNEKETKVLVLLQDALKDIPEDYFARLDEFRPLAEEDLSSVFRAVYLFTKAKFKANEIRALADTLDYAVLELSKDEGETPDES